MFLLVGDIKDLTFKFDGHKHPSNNLHDAKRNFYRYYQTGQTTNPKCLETFNDRNRVINILPPTD